MNLLYLLAKASFYAVLGLSLGAAILVVTTRNIFHSALALVAALLGVAAIYVYLRAEFLAVMQILLYVGAIMTLLIFAIMLTHRIGDRTIPQTNRQSSIALVTLSAFAFFLILAIVATPWKLVAPDERIHIDAASLGTALMTKYVLPFEIVSVVLLVALIGAIILARTDEP